MRRSALKISVLTTLATLVPVASERRHDVRLNSSKVTKLVRGLRRFMRARRAALVVLPILMVGISGSSTANAAMYGSQDLRWPYGVVYYAFDDSLPLAYQQAVNKAVDQYYEHRGRTGVVMSYGTNGGRYVKILPTWSGPSRVSDTGYTGRTQYMYLNQNVPPIWQVVVHEFGHVIGLEHEHQRCERDIWLDVPDPTGPMAKQCKLPTVERYNPMSIMHYSSDELRAFGASLKPSMSPIYSAPAKSLHPGLVESDLRTIQTMYRRDGTISLVSEMHGKCLHAPARDNGTTVRLFTCDPVSPNQVWAYNASSGEFKIDANKCLDASETIAIDLPPVVIRDCDGRSQQRWDLGEQGQLVPRFLKDRDGRQLCAQVNHWDRRDGAALVLQYCHRSDNQQWVRGAAGWRAGPVTFSIVSDLIPANVDAGPQPSKCFEAPSEDYGTPIQLGDCRGPYQRGQRFLRTVGEELRIRGDNPQDDVCVDGHDGRVGDPVRLWGCNGAPNQRWQLTALGTLSGINGLCIDVAKGRSVSGSELRLEECVGNASQRWSTRDPG